MSRGRRKLGLGGWALNGGLFFGGIPGSGWGRVGAATLGACAFKFWIAMESAATPEIRARLLPLFVIASVAGMAFIAIGYGQYAARVKPRS